MARQLWATGQATSVEDLNTALGQVARRYRTTTEADADNPTPTAGQIRIITGIDLPTRDRALSAFQIQYYRDGTGWQDALLATS